MTSDFVVVGTNPEMADMSNPRGEIIRERFRVVATNERGDRRTFGYFKTEEEAEAWFWSPFSPGVEEWDVDRPEYGSVAYVEYGAAWDIEDERRAADDEVWN